MSSSSPVFNKEQREAVEWFRGPLLVLGTPGSGKTTVILHRVNHLITEHNVIPRQILVITFTKAAALSMEQRYRAMDKLSGGVRFSTFHAFFYWIVRTAYKFAPDCVLGEDERYKWIKDILCRISPEYGNNEETLSSCLKQIDRISNDMVDIENYYSKDMPAEEFRRLYREFGERKRRENRIDFDDMQRMCYDLLSERPDILQRIREMYPFIMVDEFQDTNLIQYEILKKLAHPLDNLFAVGDDDQSIYGFRGARPEIMLGFSKEFKGAKVLTLSTNYRCPEVVTKTSARLIGNNHNRYSKSLKAARMTKADEFVRVYKLKDDKDECRKVTEFLTEAKNRGVPWSEMAVLYRTNETPRKLCFRLRDRGIPYSMRDTLPNIFKHMAVMPVMDYLYFATEDPSRTRFLRIMNKPVRYIRRDMLKQEKVDLVALSQKIKGEPYLERHLGKLRDDLRRLRMLPPVAAINLIRRGIGVERCMLELAEERNVDQDEVKERLDELQSMAEPYGTIAEFLRFSEAYEELLKEENRKRLEPGERERGVQLMTLHSAKGLEFQEVHIIECIDGVIPHKKSRAPASMEEERRMFYVGMTRAVHRLYLYAPLMVGDKAVRPSPFLQEITNKNTREGKKDE